MKRLMRRGIPLLVLASACATAPPPSGPAQGADTQAMVAEMQQSAAAWNRGDLEGFIHPYAPDATFMGNDVVRGFDAIRDFYRGTWFRAGTPPGNLAYRDFEVRALGRDHALMLGKWQVTNRETGQELRHGVFSLTWRRTPQGWQIIHDHSG